LVFGISDQGLAAHGDNSDLRHDSFSSLDRPKVGSPSRWTGSPPHTRTI
jgi:hypothetical protein